MATLPAELTVRFDLRIFDLSIIKKALYRISADATADITVDDNTITCHLFPTSSKATPDQLVGRLRQEVLDQDLRERIASESAAYRDVILGYVFSRTGLQSDEQVP